jgi:hypothetical protein
VHKFAPVHEAFSSVPCSSLSSLTILGTEFLYRILGLIVTFKCSTRSNSETLPQIYVYFAVNAPARYPNKKPRLVAGLCMARQAKFLLGWSLVAVGRIARLFDIVVVLVLCVFGLMLVISPLHILVFCGVRVVRLSFGFCCIFGTGIFLLLGSALRL